MSKLFGKKPLLDLINTNKNVISLVHLTPNAKELISLLKRENINFKVHHDHKFFNKFDQKLNHQFVISDIIDENNYENNLSSFLMKNKNKNLLILVVDSIQDPHNFGAILRSAEAFNVDGVIFKNSHQVLINDFVFKTSLGAARKLNLFKVSNLSNAIKLLKEHKFWVYASTLSEKSQPLNQTKFDSRSAIVVGNEADGIRPILLNEADFHVKIPMYGTVQSLNVSVATGILLYAIKTQNNESN